MVKPIESKKTLVSTGDDPFHLVEQFRGYFEITAMYSYNLLVRVFKKQRNLNVSGDKKVFEVKKRKDIPANSLQNPSYSDATYSGPKSQDCQVQVLKTNTDSDDKKLKAKSLNLPEYYAILGC